MKAFAVFSLCALACFAQPRDYPVKPVPFTAVHVNDGFLGPADRNQSDGHDPFRVQEG